MCSKNDGTYFKYYDMYVSTWNAIVTVLESSAVALKFFGSFIGVVLPSGVIFPLYDSTKPLPRLDRVKVWALKFSIRNPDPIWAIFGVTPGVTVKLPKKPLIDAWREIIAPIDVFVDGSENYLYNVNGEVKLGTEFTPVRQFGILSDGVELLLDVGLVVLVCKILAYLGLGAIVSKIVLAISTYVKNKALMDQLKDLEQINVPDYSESISGLEGKIQEIKSLLGVRLLLR